MAATVTLTKSQQETLMSGCAWDFSQAVGIYKELRKGVGEGWAWVTPQVREALVAERVLSVALRSHRDSVRTRDVEQLLTAVRVLAGLLAFEEATV